MCGAPLWVILGVDCFELIWVSFLQQAQTPNKDDKKRKADGTPDGRGRKKKKQ